MTANDKLKMVSLFSLSELSTLRRVEEKFAVLVSEKYAEYRFDLENKFSDMFDQMNLNLLHLREKGVPASHNIFWNVGIRNEPYENRFDSFILYLHVDIDLCEYSFRISNKFDFFKD
jgi:hypothetical protein